MSRAWPERPKPFDVVWCWYPDVETPEAQGKKPRPALVLGVGKSLDPIQLLVAFGTSRRLERIYATEFLIAEEDEALLEESGCSRATKFDLKRRLWLPYTDALFSIKPGTRLSSPVIGRVALSTSAHKKAFKAALTASGFQRTTPARKTARTSAAAPS